MIAIHLVRYSVIAIVWAAGVLGFSPADTAKTASNSICTGKTSPSTALYYIRDEPPQETTVPAPVPIVKVKPLIHEISSLDELTFFLQEDNRPAVIKFYAPWCKKCQVLGMKFDRLVTKRGDRIENRVKVMGDVKFAQIEYNPRTTALISKSLQIPAVPTLQIYHRTRKVWNEVGSKSVQRLISELDRIRDLEEDLLEDDGILELAIEESIYDQPDFLNEEW